MADKDIVFVQQNSAGRWLPVVLSPTAGQQPRFNATKDATVSADLTTSADRGDADVVLANFTDARVQRFATTLTSNRTVTLPTTNNFNGAQFRIVRTGLGAFTLDVGGLKTIPSATAAFVDVVHDGTNWTLAAYGTL